MNIYLIADYRRKLRRLEGKRTLLALLQRKWYSKVLKDQLN